MSIIPLINLENIILGYKQHFDPAYLKRYNIVLLLSLIKNNFNFGNSIEIGSGNGETSVYIRNILDNNFTHYIFDSFEGLSEPSAEDASHPAVHYGNLACSLEKINNVMNENCVNKNIIYCKGWVNDTIPQNLPDNICFVHLDLDLFEPTYHCLKNIIPKMQNNGIIIVDDYDDPVWIGVKKACDIIENEFNIKFNRINLPGSNLYQCIVQIIKI